MLTQNSYNIFFPASGSRGSSSGRLYSGGVNGYYWSASAKSSSHGYYMNLYSSRFEYNANGNVRANGFPVRPVAEE